MPPEKQYCVCILSSHRRMLYTGSSSNLQHRTIQHKLKLIPGYTARYNIDQLVWYECTRDAQEAVQMERRIKGWTRQRKIELILSKNPEWRDLAEDIGVSEDMLRQVRSYPSSRLDRDSG